MKKEKNVSVGGKKNEYTPHLAWLITFCMGETHPVNRVKARSVIPKEMKKKKDRLQDVVKIT